MKNPEVYTSFIKADIALFINRSSINELCHRYLIIMNYIFHLSAYKREHKLMINDEKLFS